MRYVICDFPRIFSPRSVAWGNWDVENGSTWRPIEGWGIDCFEEVANLFFGQMQIIHIASPWKHIYSQMVKFGCWDNGCSGCKTVKWSSLPATTNPQFLLQMSHLPEVSLIVYQYSLLYYYFTCYWVDKDLLWLNIAQNNVFILIIYSAGSSKYFLHRPRGLLFRRISDQIKARFWVCSLW